MCVMAEAARFSLKKELSRVSLCCVALFVVLYVHRVLY